jgi:hypothetical protein
VFFKAAGEFGAVLGECGEEPAPESVDGADEIARVPQAGKKAGERLE